MLIFRRNDIIKCFMVVAILLCAIAMTACSRRDKATEYEVEAAKQAKYKELTYEKAKRGEAAREGVTKEVIADTEPMSGLEKAIVINNQKNELSIKSGTDILKIDKEGLHVSSKGGNVDISKEGVHIVDDMLTTKMKENGITFEDCMSTVNISPDGVYVNDGKGTEVNIPFPGIAIKHVISDEKIAHDIVLSEYLPKIISDVQDESAIIDFRTMDSQLMEQSITVNGVTKNIKIYVKDGYFITVNCSEEYSDINGLTLEKTETDDKGNVYRYYSNDHME